jgi:hypothetical protein
MTGEPFRPSATASFNDLLTSPNYLQMNIYGKRLKVERRGHRIANAICNQPLISWQQWFMMGRNIIHLFLEMQRQLLE